MICDISFGLGCRLFAGSHNAGFGFGLACDFALGFDFDFDLGALEACLMLDDFLVLEVFLMREDRLMEGQVALHPKHWIGLSPTKMRSRHHHFHRR